MAKSSEVIKALQQVLQESAYLTDIQDDNIVIGIREQVLGFPCVMIAWNSMNESGDVYGLQRITLNCTVRLGVQSEDKDCSEEQLDLLNNLYKALSQDVTLGGKVIEVSIGTTTNIEEFPQRYADIGVSILYEQYAVTRA